MEVLNKTERFWSFLVFLLIFILTVGIIVTAIYFDYQIPNKELSNLRLENQKLIHEYEFQDRFAKKLEEVKTFTEKLQTGKDDFYYNQQMANNVLIDMQKLIPEGDSLVANNMYDNMILAYRDLIMTKKTVSILNDEKNELKELRQKVEVYSKDLEIVKRDLEVCRIINRSGK